MSQEPGDFDLYLPGKAAPTEHPEPARQTVRKFTAHLSPGRESYDIKHGLGTENVLVQTRIGGNVREGGISIVDANTVRVRFGGTLNEAMEVVIVG